MVQQTEDPDIKPDSPLRSSLVASGTPGTRLAVSGCAGVDSAPGALRHAYLAKWPRRSENSAWRK
ncbi:hypothetical protein P3T39_003360 [Kitasatospora sp. GP82]|nr:hypothetical protein [Kitasatospora sp. GP82]